MSAERSAAPSPATRVRTRARLATARVSAVPSSPAEHRALSLLLVLAGLAHLLRPRVYDSIVPPWLPPSRRFWTVGSGLAQILAGLAVAEPRTRRLGGFAAAGVFVAVLPANVWMVWQWRRRPWPYRVGAVARLPLQVPLVAWGLRVARSATPRG